MSDEKRDEDENKNTKFWDPRLSNMASAIDHASSSGRNGAHQDLILIRQNLHTSPRICNILRVVVVG